MRHVEEKSSMALKAQVRTALLMAKEDIAGHKFSALIDYVLGERTQDKLSNNKVQFITLFSGSVSV